MRKEYKNYQVVVEEVKTIRRTFSVLEESEEEAIKQISENGNQYSFKEEIINIRKDFSAIETK